MSWQNHAACGNEDPELFFPATLEASGPVNVRYLRPARRICAACPVADACLRWALDTGQDHGIWAGTTPDDRRALRRARRRDVIPA